MIDPSKLYAHCPSCDTKLKIVQTQPYQDYTWRIEIDCPEFECEWDGLLIEVKV